MEWWILITRWCLFSVRYSRLYRIKVECKSEMSEIVKLFGSTKKLIDKSRSGENVPSLEVVEVVLVQCNLVDSQYQPKSEVLYTFRPNKSYASLLNVEPSNLVFLKLIKQILTKLSQHLRGWKW